MAEKETELKLSDFLHLCVAFKKDPTEENEKAIVDFMQSLQVVDYMPLRYKEINMALIVHCASFTERLQGDDGIDVHEIVANMEIGMVMYGLLSYAINLDNDMKTQALDAAVYDTVHQFGLVKHILRTCKEDYEKLRSLVEQSVNFANIMKIVNTSSLLSPESLDEFTRTMKALKEDLTDEKLKSLAAISQTMDPAWATIKGAVEDGAVEKALQIDVKKLENLADSTKRGEK